MNAAKPKAGEIGDPGGADPRSQWVNEAPKTSKAPAEPIKRLTVDIPERIHKALSYAKTDTGKELRVLVTEAVRAYSRVAWPKQYPERIFSDTPEPFKRLTVDIPEQVHKTLSYAKTDTGKELRVLVVEALSAYPPIAERLPTMK